MSVNKRPSFSRCVSPYLNETVEPKEDSGNNLLVAINIALDSKQGWYVWKFLDTQSGQNPN